MGKKNTIFLILVILVIIGAIFYFRAGFNDFKSSQNSTASSSVDNFYQCQDAGYPTTSAYPRECQQPNGPTFVEDLLPATTTNEISYKDLINVTNIQAGQNIESPLHIEGEARGTWYFEATFPISILDANGKEIGQGQAKAKGDWQTSDYVPFSADVTFSSVTTSTTSNGSLVLKKDNPSGDPAKDESLTIPVSFVK